jgi:hypothetical protein
MKFARTWVDGSRRTFPPLTCMNQGGRHHCRGIPDGHARQASTRRICHQRGIYCHYCHRRSTEAGCCGSGHDLQREGSARLCCFRPSVSLTPTYPSTTPTQLKYALSKRRWLRRLSAWGTQNCVPWGDSTVAGVGAAPGSASWTDRFRAMLFRTGTRSAAQASSL